VGDLGPGSESVPDLTAFRGVDALLLETLSDWPAAQIRGCARAFADRDVPVLVSLTYWRTPAGELRTYGGEPPEHYARMAQADGVAALGVNCGRDIGMEEVIEIVRRYRTGTDLPLFARPNAGTPVRVEGRWLYPRTPEEMAARVPELLAAGATLIGGCCGTTPAHTAAFGAVLSHGAAPH
jgi:5-methyltetrahydrofolate--homocysteine methyltransferase